MSERQPACPRCAYDLAGIVESWADSCPITGTCSECGLEFRWRDLLDPEFTPPRSFEHAPRGKIIGAFFKTLLVALRPWVLWRWIRMEHPFVKGRALAFLPLSLLTGEIIVVSLLALLVTAVDMTIQIYWSAPYLDWHLREAILCVGQDDYYVDGLWPSAVGALVGAASAPLLLLIFTQSLRLSRIQRHHLARVLVYSAAGLPMLHLLFGLAAIVRIAGASLADAAYSTDRDVANMGWRTYSIMAEWGGTVCALFCVFLSCLFTHLAMTRYLRVKWAWKATAAIALVCFLAAFTVMIALAPYDWAWLVGPGL